MAKIGQIQEVAIADLVPYDRNAKLHPKDQIDLLCRSIGFLNPCLIDKENNVIAGHGRIEAARKLGMDKVPCVYVEGLTEAQRRAYILADNRLTELGEWDMEIVFEELNDLRDLDFDISLTGFELDDVESETIEDDFDEDLVSDEEICKLGDIWTLGKHRPICGDSTDINVVDRLMDGAKADMLLTDPPYNVDYTGKTKDALKIKNDNMDNDSFRQFLRDAFSTADAVMRSGAVFYIWHADSEGYNFRGACADNGWKVRECLIWNKNSMVLGRQDYQWKHEPCLYGWKEGASHLWASDRKQTTVLNFDRPSRADLHPTMKPIGLFAYQISNNTHEGDAVLDLFGGSGTTLIACEQLNRKCYMCELDQHYCDVIIKRWETFTGEKAVRIDG